MKFIFFLSLLCVSVASAQTNSSTTHYKNTKKSKSTVISNTRGGLDVIINSKPKVNSWQYNQQKKKSNNPYDKVKIYRKKNNTKMVPRNNKNKVKMGIPKRNSSAKKSKVIVQ